MFWKNSTATALEETAERQRQAELAKRQQGFKVLVKALAPNPGYANSDKGADECTFSIETDMTRPLLKQLHNEMENLETIGTGNFPGSINTIKLDGLQGYDVAVLPTKWPSEEKETRNETKKFIQAQICRVGFLESDTPQADEEEADEEEAD